jgi:hypothetical protein
MLKHFSTDRAFDGLGILAVKRAYLDTLPVTMIRLPDLWDTTRLHNCFKQRRIITLSDLMIRTEADLLRTRNLEKKTLARLKKVLEHYDHLELGCDLSKAEIPEVEQEWCRQIYDETIARLRNEMKKGTLTIDILLH